MYHIRICHSSLHVLCQFINWYIHFLTCRIHTYDRVRSPWLDYVYIRNYLSFNEYYSSFLSVKFSIFIKKKKKIKCAELNFRISICYCWIALFMNFLSSLWQNDVTGHLPVGWIFIICQISWHQLLLRSTLGGRLRGNGKAMYGS